MPVYDYRCIDCGERFEVTRPMASTSKEECPSCAAPAKRVFTPVGVAFKGSGFHNTDYKTRPKEDTGSCPAKKDGTSACSSCPAAE
jgi:putative FmdB family regulatory protein